MSGALFLGGVVIIACIVCNKITDKFGIPALLAFIVLGMLFGSDGIFKIPFENYAFAEDVCITALIFIMFYGGFGTKWSAARPVAVKSILLSTVGVAFTALLTGIFCHLAFKMELFEGMLIGAVLSSTDAASVFSVLRSNKLSLKYNTDSMLEIESGSNDPCAYMITLLIIQFMSRDITAGYAALMVVREISVGVLCGAVIAFASSSFLRKFKFDTDGFDSAFMIAVALIGYALPTELGGNGFLSVYIIGIILGNTKIKDKKTLVHFFDGVTELMQMIIFFLLGLLATPSYMPKVLLVSIAVFLFLLLVARPISVGVLLAPFKARLNQMALVSWAGLRGAASIVFAIMVTIGDVYTKNDVYHITLTVVLLSIALQGTLLPYISKKLDMIDKHGNVMKTFSDYSDEENVQFIRLEIDDDHKWIGKSVKELSLIPDTLLVMIRRNGGAILPNGDTVLENGDVVVLSATGYHDRGEQMNMREVDVTKKHKWKGQNVSELTLKENTLLIMIKRGNKIIIPRGNTTIEEKDTVIVGTL